MSIYHYTALKDNKIEIRGTLEAETPAEARAKVKALGFLPTGIFIDEGVKPQIRQADKLVYLGLSDKILLTSELAVMFTSGISTIEALETAELHAPKDKIKLVARTLKEKIMHGSTFTDALRAYEPVFGELYISICEAGENSGTLDKSMEYLTNLLKKQNSLKMKIISMSVYPIILVLLLIAVYIICGVYVFPEFIEKANIDAGDVPIMVKVITVPCDILFSNWISILITSAAVIFGAWWISTQKFFKDFTDKFLLDTPKVSEFVQYINLSYFFAVLHVSYEAGVPISRCLELSTNTVSNGIIKMQAENAGKMVANGQELSMAFNISGLVPPVLNVLIASGEKAGRLGQMFRDVSIAIDKQLETASEVLSKAFEPALLIVIGCFVAYVVIAFFQMYGSFFQNLG